MCTPSLTGAPTSSAWQPMEPWRGPYALTELSVEFAAPLEVLTKVTLLREVGMYSTRCNIKCTNSIELPRSSLLTVDSLHAP